MRKLILVMALLAETALGQAVTIGTMPVRSSGIQSPGAIPITYVNDSYPATANGVIDRVSIRWSGGTSCSGAIRLRVFRYSFGDLFVVADRGPYDVQPGYVNVTLSPSLPVNAGDLLGITLLQPPAACGSVLFSDGSPAARTIQFNGSPGLGTFITDSLFIRGKVPGMIGFAGTEYLAAVIPVVGAINGAFGSQFRTAMQLTNPENAGLITGRVVYHPARQSASPSDKATGFILGEKASQTYTNVTIDDAGSSGLASADIFTSSAPPFASARIYETKSSAGAVGFVEDAISTDQIMGAGESATFQLPTDLILFRMNIGVRSMSAGATLQVQLYSGPGGPVPLTTITKTYPANYFDQVSLATFLNNFATPTHGHINVTIQSGSAIVYATTTDNATNDSSIQIGRRP